MKDKYDWRKDKSIKEIIHFGREGAIKALRKKHKTLDEFGV